jgi:hypothetical protein
MPALEAVRNDDFRFAASSRSQVGVVMKPTVGIILSDTAFRRPVGDVGNAASYACPAIFHVARGVSAADMVQAVPNMDLLETYLQGALDLQRRGASVITTTCGFLAALQKPIADRLDVPFIASSLLQIPLVSRNAGGRIGIITANDACLTKAHLASAGVGDEMPIAILGLQRHKAFADPILNGIGEIDLPEVERCVATAARQLLLDFPDIKAFVCECHNLPPFSAAIERETGKPVFDILTLVCTTLHAVR